MFDSAASLLRGITGTLENRCQSLIWLPTMRKSMNQTDFSMSVDCTKSLLSAKIAVKQWSILIFLQVISQASMSSARRHTCPGKILLACSHTMQKGWIQYGGCNRTTCKWKVTCLLFSRFSYYQFPSTYVHSCSCRQTQINQIQMKTKASSTATKVERLSLFLLVFGLFFHSVHI